MRHLFLTSSIGSTGVAASVRKALGHARPLKTAFITTTIETQSEQADFSWYEADRQALKAAGFDFFEYTITGKTAPQIRTDLANIEALYVSGGNGLYLLQEVQASGFIPVVRELVERGIIYLGTSSGSAIAGPDLYPLSRVDTLADAPKLQGFAAFGLVDFCILPHWGSVYFREIYLDKRLEHIYAPKWQLILLNDNQYVEVKDDWYQIVDVTKA